MRLDIVFFTLLIFAAGYSGLYSQASGVPAIDRDQALVNKCTSESELNPSAKPSVECDGFEVN